MHSKANNVTVVRICNFTKTNTPPWLFYTLLKLYKCYQIGFTLSKIQHSLNNHQLVRDIKTLKVIIIKLLLKFNLKMYCFYYYNTVFLIILTGPFWMKIMFICYKHLFMMQKEKYCMGV